MRSDFVSSVTHELKTPLAAIRAMLTRSRAGPSPRDTIRDYAELSCEAKRLTPSSTTAAYARVTRLTEVYSFEPSRHRSC